MKLLREPLLHFLLLGGALYAAWALAGTVADTDAARRVEIDAAELERLVGGWRRQWQRPPTAAELRGLVDARVREEVLYREALAVGLDRNDAVVRRRLVQKMEMLSQDLASLNDPTDVELRGFFDTRREDYRLPARIDFSHIYFNTDRRGAAAADDARAVLDALRAQSPVPTRAPELGDRFMLRYEFEGFSSSDARRGFGTRFAEQLFEFPRGWHGPIESGFGLHLVFVGARVEGRVPGYDEVRDTLVNDFNRDRVRRARDALYAGVAEGYDVVVDEASLAEIEILSDPD